jgi:hypothetical protein
MRNKMSGELEPLSSFENKDPVKSMAAEKTRANVSASMFDIDGKG